MTSYMSKYQGKMYFSIHDLFNVFYAFIWRCDVQTNMEIWQMWLIAGDKTNLKAW